jgi:hypothetical protein
MKMWFKTYCYGNKSINQTEIKHETWQQGQEPTGTISKVNGVPLRPFILEGLLPMYELGGTINAYADNNTDSPSAKCASLCSPVDLTKGRIASWNGVFVLDLLVHTPSSPQSHTCPNCYLSEKGRIPKHKVLSRITHVHPTRVIIIVHIQLFKNGAFLVDYRSLWSNHHSIVRRMTKD